MNKIYLYINTLSNLSFNQIFFLGYNKIIKKYFNLYLLRTDKVTLHSKKRTEYTEVKENIIRILGTEDTWKLGVKELQIHLQYYNNLKKNILLFAEQGDISPFLSFWNTKSDDIELNYNYQRFYLFKEIFDEIQLSDEKQIELLERWIESNKKNKYAWMGFNCAIRLINWIKILKDIDVNNVKVDKWEKIEDSIYQQFIFNSKNIEHHIPGNHVLFQFYADWLVSNIFTKWYSQSKKEEVLNLLLKEFKNEYLDDGLHFELSTHYHLQVTLLGLSLISQLNNIGVVVPKILLTLMKKATSVLNKFLIGDYYPAIGDGCYNFFHENKYQDLENLNYLQKEYFSLEDEGNNQIQIDNNFQIVDNNLFKIIFDVGNIGLHNNPGHGHSDLLSIILGYNEIPIFIDPGTYQYKNSEESLELKKTVSHNTVSINGEDQAKLWGFFRWAYLPQNIKSSFKSLSNSIIILESEFNGYRYLGGINHKRNIKINSNEVSIIDSLQGNLEKKYLVNFVLHPEIIVEQKKNIILLKYKLNKYELKCTNQNAFVFIEDILIYDSYDSATPSKKIVFTFKNNDKKSKLDSEIIFKVLN